MTDGTQTEEVQSQRVLTEPSPETASPKPSRSFLARLRREESAQDMVEYGLLGVVLALGAVSGINHLADKVSNAFGRIDNRIDKATQNDGDRDHGGDHGDHGGWGWH